MAFALTFSVAGNAQMLANWAFSNNLTATNGPNNTASNAALSAGIPSGAYNGGNLYYGQDGWPTGAVNPAMYLEFSLTPNAGQQLHLEQMELVLRRSNLGTPSGGGPRAWALRSSLDGFTTDIGSGTLGTANSTSTVNFGTEFHFLSSVTFRLYGYDVHVNPGGSNRFVFDNIRVTGLSILPIKFSAITGQISNDGPIIQWATEGADLIDFVLERSTDGLIFSSVTQVKGHTQPQYSVTDATVGQDFIKLFYRIKAVRPTGESIYSDIIVLQQTPKQKLEIKTITSNRSNLHLQLFAPDAGSAVVRITTSQGAVILQQPVSLSKGLQELSLFNIQSTVSISTLTIATSNTMVSKQFLHQ